MQRRIQEDGMEIGNLDKETDFIMEQAVNLLQIDSPTGYTEEAARYVA